MTSGNLLRLFICNMARIQDRQKAIVLRRQGKTYSEIRKELNVAKSTLSDWLKNYALTESQLLQLKTNIREKKQLAIEKTRKIKQKKREVRLAVTYQSQKEYWLTLNKREVELAGIFLYWGEGNKRMNGPISLNNTDPQVLKFTLFWLLQGLGVEKSKIKVYLYLYKDMDIQKEMEFWSQELNMPIVQFVKPYIKASKRIEIEHKGYGHGTCGLVVNDVRLKEKVMMSIKAISECYTS